MAEDAGGASPGPLLDKRSTLQSAKSLSPNSQLLAPCPSAVNLKSVFRHLDATLPKYQLRCGRVKHARESVMLSNDGDWWSRRVPLPDCRAWTPWAVRLWWQRRHLQVLPLLSCQHLPNLPAAAPPVLLCRRAFGCNTPIGLIYSINPAMIVRTWGLSLWGGVCCGGDRVCRPRPAHAPHTSSMPARPLPQVLLVPIVGAMTTGGCAG